MRRDARTGGVAAMIGLFRLPGFGRLSVAYALNELAWFVGTVSLALLVYRRTGSTLGSAGFFLCSQGAPALVGPILVGRLDRRSPRALLPAIYGLEAVLFGLLAWLAHDFLLGPVLVLVVVDGTVALVARSLASGARTEILKPRDLVREGAALQNILASSAYLLGPVIAGAVAAVGGTVAALLVDCGLFAAMAVSLVSPSIPSRIVHEGPERGRLRAAIAYTRRHRPIASVMWLQVAAFVVFAIPTPLEVVLTDHTLHAGAAGYGGLLAAWGAGALFGSAMFLRWRRCPVRWLLAGAALALGGGFAAMAAAPEIEVALAGAALAGIGNGLGAVAFNTEVMDRAPQSWMALVVSLQQSIYVFAPGIGIALGGGLAAAFGTRSAFAIAAGGSVVVAGLALLLLAPARMIDPETDSGDGPASDADVTPIPVSEIPDAPTLA